MGRAEIIVAIAIKEKILLINTNTLFYIIYLKPLILAYYVPLSCYATVQ